MNVRFPSNRFTYHRPTQTFVAEMSDLQIDKPDSITIVSTRTGDEVEFFFSGRLQEQEDYDGELRGYEYKSYNNVKLHHNGYKIHLYND
jgi:hypothetical protein